MNENEKNTETTIPVTAVKKWIKLYSDNSMHEAIDRIINSCACIDEGDDYCGLASVELREAAEDLLILACKNLIELQRKRERSMNEKKAN